MDSMDYDAFHFPISSSSVSVIEFSNYAYYSIGFGENGA